MVIMLDQVMIKKLYTHSHSIDLLKEIDNDGEQFTAEEHAYIMKTEFGKNVYKTRENLLRVYLPGNLLKLGSLGFLIESIKQNGYSNIISLGAGQCVLEYLLKISLSEESQVCACDFDSFFIDDHVPQTHQDSDWGHQGRAFANGYIQAMIEAVTKEAN